MQRQGADAASSSRLATSLLVVLVGGLAAGGAAHLSGAGRSADQIFAGLGVIGALYSLWAVVAALLHRRLGVDVIALLAILGALLLPEYLAAAVISVMLATGRALEDWSKGKARRDLGRLVERQPRTAHRYLDGSLETIEVAAIAVGDRLMVATGEVVPVDGRLASTAVLDESSITGESLPVPRAAHDTVRSGVTNAGPPLELWATSTASESTYAGILALVEEAEQAQPRFVRLADRYALLLLAVTAAIAGIAWLIGGAGRAVAVLVVATPCPLILAAPIAYVAALSISARRGVIVRSGAVLERLANCTTMLLDKTGTLTEGRPQLVAIVTAPRFDEEVVLQRAASVEQYSPHPLAEAMVLNAVGRGLSLPRPSGVVEDPGSGISGLVDDEKVAVGPPGFVGLAEIPPWAEPLVTTSAQAGALTAFVALDGAPAGVLSFEDPLRDDAAATLDHLRQGGVSRLVMVTGDRREVASSVASQLGLDGVVSESTPPEKLKAVRDEQQGASVIMVGDGVNDAPALAAADVGVAIGARGATASTAAADIVLGVDRLDRLSEARAIAVRTRQIALESVIWGMGLSFVAMLVAAAGYLPAVWGALLQEGIDVAVIVNALRALRWDEATWSRQAGGLQRAPNDRLGANFGR